MQPADDSHYSDFFTYKNVFYKILSIAHILQQKPIGLYTVVMLDIIINITINLQALVLSLKT